MWALILWCISGSLLLLVNLLSVSAQSSSSDSSSRILPIPPAIRGSPIEVDAIEGFGRAIRPGDRVDVLLSYHEEGTLVKKAIIENVRVLNVGGKVFPSTNKHKEVVTLELVTVDALKIQTAHQIGPLILRLHGSSTSDTTSLNPEKPPMHSSNCIRGHLSMAEKKYEIDCNGAINEITISKTAKKK